MIEFILSVVGFAIKAAVVFGMLALFWLIISAASRTIEKLSSEPKIKYLNDQMLGGARALYNELHPKKKFPDGDASSGKLRAFVIDFNGNQNGDGGGQLEREVTSIIAVANPTTDSVVMRLSSPGGTVTGYGFAASQLERIRDAGLHLTVCVDQVAASGGYLMACVANQIVASPFATIGSIGVVLEMPNFFDLLQKIGISMFTETAGESKRTVTPWSAPTAEAKLKLKSKLEDVHSQFKTLISKYRPGVDIDAIATGETWLGSQAKQIGLVDQIETSEAYLASMLRTHSIYSVRIPAPKGRGDGIAARALSRLIAHSQMKFI